MKKIILVLVSVMFMAGAGRAAADGPSNYEQDWVPAMNQPSYWAPWDCTKYDGHGGRISAKYDAAVIKAGQFVRVYPDLENVGAFQAVGPQGKDISWVMKCEKPVPPPTTQPPVTTVPETTVPETTVPEPTVPEPTVPEETVPTEPNPTTPVPDTTPVPETPETGTQPPISPTTPDTPPALAETGAGTNLLIAIASLLVLAGIGFWYGSRE